MTDTAEREQSAAPAWLDSTSSDEDHIVEVLVRLDLVVAACAVLQRHHHIVVPGARAGDNEVVGVIEAIEIWLQEAEALFHERESFHPERDGDASLRIGSARSMCTVFLQVASFDGRGRLEFSEDEIFGYVSGIRRLAIHAALELEASC